MVTFVINPSKPPEEFPFRNIPWQVMSRCRETGASDTQIQAVYDSIIRQTFTLIKEGHKVTWPGIGTWSWKFFKRTQFRRKIYGIHITRPACWQASLRHDWRQRY